MIGFLLGEAASVALDAVLPSRKRRRLAEDGAFEASIRPHAEGGRWQAGTVRLRPGFIDFSPVVAGVRFLSAGSRSYVIESLDIRPRHRIRGREQWSVNASCVVVAFSTADGDYEWALMEDQVDEALACVRSDPVS